LKIRNGFVSNSSSSSFIIGVKDNFSEEEILKHLNENLSLPENHPLKKAAEIIIDHIFDEINFENVSTSEKEYRGDLEDDELSFLDLDAIELLKEGWKIYSGSFHNEGFDGVDLTGIAFEIKNDNFCLFSE
jgi:hypothetical protein